MKKKRPINLNFMTIKFPITAIASILHRISGIITFMTIGVILMMLDTSLSSVEGFRKISNLANNYLFKFFFWLISTLFLYHLISGIRHILIDFNFKKKNTFTLERYFVIVSFITTIFFSFLIGKFIW